MNAIKKRLQTLKIEKDMAIDRADICDQQAREANKREEKLRDILCELGKKLNQMEKEYKVSRENLKKSDESLYIKEKSFLMAQSELAILNRKMQQKMENLEKTEERHSVAEIKLSQATETADVAQRICTVLKNHRQLDEKRMDQLTSQLKEAKLIADDADAKSDEISRKLAFVEDELETAEDRVKSSDAKIAEREDELFIVGNILKSLQVAEQKANHRVGEFKVQLAELKEKLYETEKRVIIAEKMMEVLQQELDAREDKLSRQKEKSKHIYWLLKSSLIVLFHIIYTCLCIS